jgi:hypothetical protein
MMLTILELKKLLEEKCVDRDSYDINLDGEINCRNGYAIKKIDDEYLLYQMFNGEKYSVVCSDVERAIGGLFRTEYFSDSNPFYWDEDRRKKEEKSFEFHKNRDRSIRKGLKEYADAYEAQKKAKTSKMTFGELKYIFIKEDIDPYSWDILGNARVCGYDGYVIKEAECGYDVCYMERGEYSFLYHSENEHSACMLFFKVFAEDGDINLVKYINANDIPDDILVKTRNPRKYDLKNAFLLSKKLKRPLNNEEVGRFKIK